MAYEIFVIGIGPGSPDYLLPLAIKAVADCNALAGGKRALKLFPDFSGATCLIGSALDEVSDFIDIQSQIGNVGVLVSGDPGFYSLLTYLRSRFPGRQFNVIPGISSVQLAFARLGIPWNDGCLASLHGRETDVWVEYLKYNKPVGLLTDKKYAASFIRSTLIRADFTDEDIEMFVCANLSYEDEKITQVQLKNMEAADYTNAVVVITAKTREKISKYGGGADA